jgi:hypothetical protein
MFNFNKEIIILRCKHLRTSNLAITGSDAQHQQQKTFEPDTP